MVTTHHRTCHICEAHCGLVLTTKDRTVLSVKGDPDNALSRGYICPKATALQDIQDDPDRIRTPQKRIGDRWIDISWDQAFSEIGERTRYVLAREGVSSAAYFGNPGAHNYAILFNGAFLVNALETHNVFTANTLDQMPSMVTNLLLYGHQEIWAVPDIERMRTLIVLGANPVVSNGSMWTVPDFRERLKNLQDRGGQMIVVDPRRNETAKLADRHFYIRPSTDLYFLIALARDVLARVPRDQIHPLIDGIAAVETALGRFDVADCAAECGVSLPDIAWLGEQLTSGPAALYSRLGITGQVNGTLNTWLIAVINIVTGQLDRDGGLLFNSPTIDLATVQPRGEIGRFYSRVSGHPEVMSELPAACLAEEIDTPGDGRIKALFVIAGNPVLSTPNGTRLDRALQTLDLMVSIDLYRNATSRHAHYILPGIGPLERDHMTGTSRSVRNVAVYSLPTFPPAPDALQDWEILRKLAEAITGDPVQEPAPRDVLDALLRSGPRQISLEQLESNRSGMDFGPLVADQLECRLLTADKRIDCAPAILIDALAEIPARLPRMTATGLKLIGRRNVRTNNSWLSNSRRLAKGPMQCTLFIHPDDARSRGLDDGDTALVSSERGEVTLPIEVTADIVPGTVSIPHGWGHGLRGIAMHLAAGRAGISINDLTDDNAIDPLSGNAGLSAAVVEVSRVRRFEDSPLVR